LLKSHDTEEKAIPRNAAISDSEVAATVTQGLGKVGVEGR